MCSRKSVRNGRVPRRLGHVAKSVNSSAHETLTHQPAPARRPRTRAALRDVCKMTSSSSSCKGGRVGVDGGELMGCQLLVRAPARTKIGHVARPALDSASKRALRSQWSVCCCKGGPVGDDGEEWRVSKVGAATVWVESVTSTRPPCAPRRRVGPCGICL
jgi:hypothetical protein